jgi:hypothetical protein
MIKLVQVGKRLIPVRPGDPTLVLFAAGAHGRKEKGRYAFWHISGEDQWGPWAVWGRCRATLSPGDRFHRMRLEQIRAKKPSTRRAYARMFALAQTGAIIRPATMREVALWASTHEDDAKHIYGIRWAGRWHKRIPRALR